VKDAKLLENDVREVDDLALVPPAKVADARGRGKMVIEEVLQTQGSKVAERGH
jgi:hypothetical protein